MEGTARSLRIVLVEDHLDTADVLKRLLESNGYRVDMCHSGGEALTLVPASRPDIVLLDIGLPDMDGCDVARLLRQGADFKSVLVAVTGYGQTRDHERAREAGIDLHLLKPVGLDDLQAALQAAATRLKVQ